MASRQSLRDPCGWPPCVAVINMLHNLLALRWNTTVPPVARDADDASNACIPLRGGHPLRLALLLSGPLPRLLLRENSLSCRSCRLLASTLLLLVVVAPLRFGSLEGSQHRCRFQRVLIHVRSSGLGLRWAHRPAPSRRGQRGEHREVRCQNAPEVHWRRLVDDGSWLRATQRQAFGRDCRCARRQAPLGVAAGRARSESHRHSFRLHTTRLRRIFEKLAHHL